MNSVESELEWLIYQLWTKIGPSPTKFNFIIPDTVFFRENSPSNWYFTSKEGHILKKNKVNISLKNIHSKFSKKLQVQDQVAALGYYYQKESAKQLNLYMNYIPVIDFRTFMFFSEGIEKPQALQKFVSCKQMRHTTIRCHWSSSISVIEKVTNNNSFYDQKLTLDERVCTFEGPEHLSKSENVVSSSILEEITLGMKQIEQHLKLHCNISLISGYFYFKQDLNDQFNLILATNIKIDKSEKYIFDSFSTQVKLFMRKSDLKSFNDQLPAVIAPQRRNNSRPQSSYSKQTTSSFKFQLCPFCNKQMSQGDSFEYTYNQILKLYSFYDENSHLLLESADTQEKLNFNKKLYMNICNSKDQIPFPFSTLFPGLSNETFQIKRQDPLFIYQTMKLCEVCYSFIKSLVLIVEQQAAISKDQKIDSLHKLASLVFNHPITQNQFKLKAPKHRGGISKSKTGPLNSDIMFNQYNLTKHSVNTTQAQQEIGFSGFQKVFQGQEQLIPGSNLEQDSQQVRIDSGREMFNYSDNSSQNNKAVSMFHKVEKGQEIGESNIFNYPKSMSNNGNESQSEMLEQHPKIINPIYNFVKVQDPPKVPKRTLIRNPLPKLDWKKEQKEKLVRASIKAKEDIFEVLDKIEASTSFAESQNESLNLKIKTGKGTNKVMDRSFNQPANTNAPIHKKEKFETQRISEQPRSNTGFNIEKIKKIYQQQETNIRIRGSERIPNQRNSKSKETSKLARPKSSHQNENKIVNQKRRNLQAEYTPEVNNNCLNLMTQSCFKENQLQNCQQPVYNQKFKNARPVSSKIQTYQQYNFNNNNLVSSATSSKHLLISYRDSSTDKQSLRKNEIKKPSMQVQPEIQTPIGMGLLNLENMTSDDIKSIAQNADQLIEIIQNIKNKVEPQQSKPLSNQVSPGFANVGEFPLIEDEDEEDISNVEIPKKQEGGDNWW